MILISSFTLILHSCASNDSLKKTTFDVVAESQNHPNSSLLDFDSILNPIIPKKVLIDSIAEHNIDTNIFKVKFSVGHVDSIGLENYLYQTDYGFKLELQSPSPLSTPTIIDTLLYASGGFGTRKFYCFNALNGNLVWATGLSDDGPSSCVFKDSLIIFNTESCTVFALNRFNGKMSWSFWLGDPLMSTPTVCENTIITAYPNSKNFGINLDSLSHALICMDIGTGSILWQQQIDGDILGAPIVNEEFIFLTTFSGSLYKIDKAKGEVLSSKPLRATSPPTVVSSHIYISHRADKNDQVNESISVLNTSDLSLIKSLYVQPAPYLDYKIQARSDITIQFEEYDQMNGFFGGAPATANAGKAAANIGQNMVSSLQMFQSSTVYHQEGRVMALMGDKLLCINAQDGSVIWNYKFDGDLTRSGGTLATTPVFTESHVITTTLAGHLMVLNQSTGEVSFEKKLDVQCRTSPIVVGGNIYIPTTTGSLHVVRTGMKQLDGWPMLMKNSSHNIVM